MRPVIALPVLALGATALKCQSSVHVFDSIHHIRGESNAGIPEGEASAVCGNLWHHLKSWAGCVASDTWCGMRENPDSDDGQQEFFWTFRASSSCNGGKVESVWWSATKNDYGALAC